MDEVFSILYNHRSVISFSVGCNGVKHVISIEEPTDHTSGDDGGKLKYKIIFGDVNQKE